MNADLLLIGSFPTTFLLTSSDRLVELDFGLGFSFYTIRFCFAMHLIRLAGGSGLYSFRRDHFVSW